MIVRSLSVLLLFLAVSIAAQAQNPDFSSPDSVLVDTAYVEPDTSYYDGYDTGYEYDTTGYGEYDTAGYDGSYDYGYEDSEPSPVPFLSRGGGIFAGPTFELTALAPSSLDPELDGDMVLFGGQAYVIIKGWQLGGTWVSATLYDMSTRYDEFSFSFGGFQTGYDLEVLDAISVRLGAMIGGGDLKMVKRRPELTAIDTTGHEILERFREESFFMVRPGASVGYSPLPFLDLRIAADYLFPIGGKNIADLRTLTYGLHIMLGFGR